MVIVVIIVSATVVVVSIVAFIPIMSFDLSSFLFLMAAQFS
jgi:hypothetical protein